MYEHLTVGESLSPAVTLPERTCGVRHSGNPVTNLDGERVSLGTVDLGRPRHSVHLWTVEHSLENRLHFGESLTPSPTHE